MVPSKDHAKIIFTNPVRRNPFFIRSMVPSGTGCFCNLPDGFKSQSLFHQVNGSFSENVNKRNITDYPCRNPFFIRSMVPSPCWLCMDMMGCGRRNPFFIRSMVPSQSSLSECLCRLLQSQSLFHQVNGSFQLRLLFPM